MFPDCTQLRAGTGNRTATSGGVEAFPAARPGGVVKVPVVINNHSATFILDTGASLVVLVVEADSAAAFGADGLLGLSFLSRFNVTIDGHTVRIATSKPR